MKKISWTSRKTFEIILVIALGISFLLWLLDFFFYGWQSKQMSTFFGNMGDFWADFSNTVGYNAYRSPYNNEVYAGLQDKQYPPLAYVIFYMFSRLTNNMPTYYENHYFLNLYYEPLYAFFFVLFWIVCTLILFECVRHYTTGLYGIKCGFGLLFILSYPVLYNMERGNLIIIVMGLIFFYIFNYDNDSPIMRELAYISLAIATGIKFVPAVFGILIIYKKRWFAAIRTCVYGALFVFLPFLFFEGGFANIPLWYRNMQLSSQFYSPIWGSSLIASIQGVISQFGFTLENKSLFPIMIVNYVVCILLLIIAAICKEEWKRVMAVSIVVLAAPGRSGGYNLLFLLPCMVLFLNEEEHKLYDYFVLLGIFMIMHIYRSDLQQHFLNNHWGMIILTIFMLVEGVRIIVNKFIKNELKDEVL